MSVVANISARRSASATGSSSGTFGSSYRSPKRKNGDATNGVPGGSVMWNSGVGSVKLARQQANPSNGVAQLRRVAQATGGRPLRLKHIPLLERLAERVRVGRHKRRIAALGPRHCRHQCKTHDREREGERKTFRYVAHVGAPLRVHERLDPFGCTGYGGDRHRPQSFEHRAIDRRAAPSVAQER